VCPTVYLLAEDFDSVAARLIVPTSAARGKSVRGSERAGREGAANESVDDRTLGQPNPRLARQRGEDAADGRSTARGGCGMRNRSDRGKRAIIRALLAAAGVAATMGVLVVAGGPAYAGQNDSVSVSPSNVPAGGTVRISGSVDPQGCPTSDPVTPTSDDALFPGDGFGPQTARNSQGAFALDYTVPT